MKEFRDKNNIIYPFDGDCFDVDGKCTNEYALKVIEENWPSDKNKYAEDMLKEDSMLSKIYMNEIMKNINGRANYKDVESYILGYANNIIENQL